MGMAMSSGKAWIACLGLLLGACAYQPSESEVAALPITDQLNQQAQKHIQELHQKEQASADLKTRCMEIFASLRIGMRVKHDDPIAGCAEISYTKTAHNNHEVWSWKDDVGKSVFVDNGILTTINGTLPSTAK
jgi:hypothetical protein